MWEQPPSAVRPGAALPGFDFDFELNRKKEIARV
jgi:hypothetical protein